MAGKPVVSIAPIFTCRMCGALVVMVIPVPHPAPYIRELAVQAGIPDPVHVCSDCILAGLRGEHEEH